ncbi:hypothetical protein L3X38_018111 [Prunus dulcis]|uniref:Reverse transcriptase Ty1/copia-type domain-containing protein n=1 Tax=Prunus dulcis TaxID=3755 RepID=A0AAD4WA76_PRUDU|nr:hypothetical protein L3X38_018111 [Prunus dulcis]
MESELHSMSKNGVWKLVDLPQGCEPIGCKWVYKTKRNSKGQIDRYKARLVAKGFTQQEGDFLTCVNQRFLKGYNGISGTF